METDIGLTFNMNGFPRSASFVESWGHSDSACELLFENPQGYSEKAYGIYMGANYDINNNNYGAKWLLEGPLEKPNGHAIGDGEGSKMVWIA